MRNRKYLVMLGSAVAALSVAGGLAMAESATTNQTLTAASAAAPTGGGGLLNDWLREQSSAFDSLDLGGQFRARFVSQSYFAVPGGGPAAVDFRSNTPHSENDFLLLRTRFHLGYTPAEWLQVYGEGQNSSSTADRRNPNPQSDGPVDLRQAFVKLGAGKDEPFSLKVGRQEMVYGDERLIGVSDWDNIGRVFDAAKLRYERNGFWIDAFTSRVVLPDDNRFDEPNWRNFFSGIYASTRTLCPRTELQFYLLADNAGPNSPKTITTAAKGSSPRDIYTIGTRFQTLPGQLNGWDANGEFAGQFGDFEYAPGTPGVLAGERLNQLAFATHLEGGYTFSKVEMKPRLALGLDFASGDDDPKDNDHHTFVNLYPTNHKFYGAMDLLSWQNLIDPYFKASVSPVKNLSLALTYHAFWLADTSDFLYQVNQAPRSAGGYGIQQGNGDFAGQEVDLVATYQIATYLQVQGGYGHYFTGSYIDNTLQKAGGSHDADWGYLQVVFNF